MRLSRSRKGRPLIGGSTRGAVPASVAPVTGYDAERRERIPVPSDSDGSHRDVRRRRLWEHGRTWVETAPLESTDTHGETAHVNTAAMLRGLADTCRCGCLPVLGPSSAPTWGSVGRAHPPVGARRAW